jgi:hypothetical protein
LAEAGRVLITTGSGFLSAFNDPVAGRLAAKGIGVLPDDDRAVLTLVLLHCVAIPLGPGPHQRPLLDTGRAGEYERAEEELDRRPGSRSRYGDYATPGSCGTGHAARSCLARNWPD